MYNIYIAKEQHGHRYLQWKVNERVSCQCTTNEKQNTKLSHRGPTAQKYDSS